MLTRILLAVWLSPVACGICAGPALLPPTIQPAGGWVRSPALVTLTHSNIQGDIFYTTDGSDPRDHFGHIRRGARPAVEPVSVNRSMVLRARVKSGTNWSELVAAPFTADQDFSKLLFTEIMYHPRTGTNNGSEFEEFIEWKNVGDVPLDLSGLELLYRLNEGHFGSVPVFACPPGTILPAGGFYVLARRISVFQSNYPGVPVHGELTRALDNSTGKPMWRTPDGAIAARMFFDSHAPWPVVPDNHGYFGADPEVGFSLVRTHLDPEADPTHFSSWRASTHRFGSPGADDPPPQVPPVVINELLTRSTGAQVDAVELFNPASTNVHLGGWWLADERNDPFDYMIPPGTFIPAGGYLVLDESHFNTGTNSLSFSAEGERCYLFSGDGNGHLTGYSHGFEFPGSERNVSFGRIRLSDGNNAFLPQLALTLGAPNAGPRQPPMLITEVLLRPDAMEQSFIELKNITDAPLQLWDPQFPAEAWWLGANGPAVSGYGPLDQFPTNVTIPPHGLMLLVQSDPTAFRAAHTVPAEVAVFPFRLDRILQGENQGLRLVRPARDSPTAPRARFHMLDEVDFGNAWPWKPFVSAGGQSLERIGLPTLGAEPTNWRLSPTLSSPGRDNAGNLPPEVWAGPDRHGFAGRLMTLTGLVRDDGWPGATVTSIWSQVSGPVTVPITTVSLSGAEVSFGQTGQYVFRFSATDGVFTNSDEVVLDVVPDPYETWRQAQFTATEAADEGVSGPSADPELDGLINLEEHFFGTAPKVFDAGRPIQAAVVDGFLELTWTRRDAALDVTTTVERADLVEGPWFGGPGLFARSESPGPSPGTVRVTMRSFVPVAGTRAQFIRRRLDR